MHAEELKQIVARADQAINAEDFDTLMEFYAEDATLVVVPGRLVTGREAIRAAMVRIADHFAHTLHVSQREFQVLEGGDTALVLARTQVKATLKDGTPYDVERRATYVFHRDANGQWRCVIDNSYGTTLPSEAGASSRQEN